TIKELVKRWKPEVAKGFQKSSEHLAMQDIRDSIAELKFYRENVFSI
ncbi:MAG: oligoribonuclease, partial [Gammaproteobacteria bacterium]